MALARGGRRISDLPYQAKHVLILACIFLPPPQSDVSVPSLLTKILDQFEQGIG